MGIVGDSLDDFVLPASCAMSRVLVLVGETYSSFAESFVLGPDGRTFNGLSVLVLLLCTVWASGGGSG